MFNSGYYLFPIVQSVKLDYFILYTESVWSISPKYSKLIYSICKFLIELHVVSTVYIKTYLQLISLNLDIVMHILTYKADRLISFY